MIADQLNMEGWLQKLGEKGVVKSFKKRWFKQIDDRLYYYEDPKDQSV